MSAPIDLMTNRLVLGWHIQLDNRRARYDSLLPKFHWPILSVTVSDNTLPVLRDYVAAMPHTIILARYLPAEKWLKDRLTEGMIDPASAGALGDAWAQVLIRSGLPQGVYWRSDEMYFPAKCQAAFWLKAMITLGAAGMLTGAINYSMGNPQEGDWNAYPGVFQEIDAQNGRALACVDLYSPNCKPDTDPANYVQRPRIAMDMCRAWGDNVLWVAPETGGDVPGLTNCHLDTAGYVSFFLRLNALLAAMPTFAGGALFTLDDLSGDFWISDSVFDAWAEIAAQYPIVGGAGVGQPPAPQGPPPPSPAPGVPYDVEITDPDGVRVRSGSTVNDPQVGVIPQGHRATVIDDTGERYMIKASIAKGYSKRV